MIHHINKIQNDGQFHIKDTALQAQLFSLFFHVGLVFKNKKAFKATVVFWGKLSFFINFKVV